MIILLFELILFVFVFVVTIMTTKIATEVFINNNTSDDDANFFMVVSG